MARDAVGDAPCRWTRWGTPHVVRRGWGRRRVVGRGGGRLTSLEVAGDAGEGRHGGGGEVEEVEGENRSVPAEFQTTQGTL